LDSNLALAFVIGLLSTVHCVGMCGGVMGALSFALPGEVRGAPLPMARFLLAYNGGRVLSYAVAGAVAGGLGMTLVHTSGTLHVPGVLRTFAGLLMLAVGLHLAGWLPAVARLERLGGPIWRRLEPVARRLVPVRSPFQAVLYGAVWGWLPCGLVYVMLGMAASRAGVLEGAAYMAAFGLGTVPTLATTGLFAGRLSHLRRTPLVQRGAGLAVALIGLVSLLYPFVSDFWTIPGEGGGTVP
jgi:hypothetical protein